MSTIALDSHLSRPLRFWETTVGKKAMMAATGAVLFGYVVGHLIGNLQIYSPDHARINRYAEFLHSQPQLLWVVRTFLLACVGLHILTSFQLWRLKRQARPIPYRKKKDIAADYASRTMLWSGPIVGAFIVFHILHLTAGATGLPYKELDVYNNVVNGFRVPGVAIAYIVAMAMLCMHLYHGLWSMFQSLGISHPRYTPWLKRFAALFALLIGAGNISIPAAVLAGILGS